MAVLGAGVAVLVEGTGAVALASLEAEAALGLLLLIGLKNLYIAHSKCCKSFWVK